ncbi:DNA-binding transcriptional regulator, MarR family [Peptoclostridium litorale DSM 5388]|uniref:HTH marR-type domain-containing protein n=1 Tax=Peptoclostridium litorale DSM 5388 TaxID=1121324 RepID=A0A069RIB3_PEPLI|nr:MarR family winged helix-turn-helix transcriptional regulator [Peptoclostridium litorale]KDR95885.1 hypothetical protein CLIT_8c00540 [Peptoclostridium litorale DSM 5388]SIO10694.1 DNA-binding transcriptional regulator, MarR family [Peptoclostridium litorale DSM 5388]
MDTSIFKYLFTLERDYNYFINKRLRELQIKKNDVKVIKNINQNHGISQNEICVLLKEDKVTVAKSVKKLEALGYIKRTNENADKRIVTLYVTEEGQGVRRKIMKIFEDLKTIFMKDLSPKEQEMAVALLAKMSKNMHDESTRLGDNTDK